MTNDVAKLVRQGFSEENLKKLIRLCESLSDESPALYGTLRFIFLILVEEYDGQAITVDRANLIIQTIQRPIVNLLQAADASAKTRLARLDDVYRAFKSLKL